MSKKTRRSTQVPVESTNPLPGWSLEREDLFQLLVALITVPLTWWVALGWHTNQIISGNDATFGMAYLKDFVAAAAAGASYAVNHQFAGGVATFAVSGTYPALKYLSWLGLDSVAALNVYDMLIQVAYATLGVTIARELAVIISGDRALGRLSIAFRIAATWILGFAPVVAWRIGYGHWNIIFGALVFIAVLAVFISALNRRLTIVTLLMAAFCVTNAFGIAAHQLTLYSFVFGWPIWAGIWVVRAKHPDLPAIRPRDFALGCLALIAAALLGMPALLEMVGYVRSTDAARSLSGESVIFSYTIATWADWLSSLPWTLKLMPSGRDHFLWHEINYAFGPPLLAVAALPGVWRGARRWAVFCAVVAAALLAIYFSLQTWVSDLLPALIPPLQSFRVPERAILPFALTLPPLLLAVAQVVASRGAAERARARSATTHAALGAAAVGAIAIFYLPAEIGEAIAWLITAVMIWVSGRVFRRIPVEVGLLLVGAASVAANHDRVPGFFDRETLVQLPARVGERVIAREPSLAMPLNRVVMDIKIGPYLMNSPYAAGLSSLNAYWFPPVRFIRLQSAINREAFDPLAAVFDVKRATPVFMSTRALYNITHEVGGTEAAPEPRPLGPTAGAAWMSQRLVAVASYADLAGRLPALDANPAIAYDQAWVIADDPKVVAEQTLTKAGSGCAGGKIADVEGKARRSELSFAVKSAGRCPVTVATNYLDHWRVTALREDGQRERLETFPSYGALLGFIAPPGAYRVQVDYEFAYQPWAMIIGVLGWLGLAGVVAYLGYGHRYGDFVARQDARA